MADFGSFVSRLTQLKSDFEHSSTSPPGKDVYDRLAAVVADLKTTIQSAQGELHQEIDKLAGELRAKTDAIEKQTAQAAAAKRKTAEPPGQPWEDHQGLDRGQMQALADALLVLAGPRRNRGAGGS